MNPIPYNLSNSQRNETDAQDQRINYLLSQSPAEDIDMIVIKSIKTEGNLPFFVENSEECLNFIEEIQQELNQLQFPLGYISSLNLGWELTTGSQTITNFQRIASIHIELESQVMFIDTGNRAHEEIINESLYSLREKIMKIFTLRFEDPLNFQCMREFAGSKLLSLVN
ncbi:unnamed protein product [Moneuplotes crassus]|uniref:Uncharacterized protein n=1 Tax=Euplotes crassus TaxID=5936 RepID=A0AAD1XQQ7_EUPCR|nr:unnamed protein product [Moneuplotes crassus]